MVDALDLAQEREALDRERAIAAQLARSRHDRPSLAHCADCDEPIPAARRALGGITRCVDCQSLFEWKQRR